MTEKELRNNISDISNKVEEIKNRNGYLSTIHKEKNVLINNIKDSFSNYVINLIKNEGINSYTRPNLSDIHVSFNENSNDIEVIKSLYSFIQYDFIGNEINQLYINNFDKIDSLLCDVKPLFKGGLGWMFTGRSIKEKATEAASELLDVYQSDFIRNVDNLKNSYESLDKTKAYDNFLSNVSTYVYTLNQLVDSEVYQESDPPKPDFSKLQNDERFLLQAQEGLQSILTQTNNLKQDVVNKANLMLSDEAIETLKQIPIDEIDRDKLGIKVGALKNSGVNTIYDAYKASVWQLSSIYGISDDAAYRIHQKAMEMKERTTQNVRLKLNSDKKTTSGTRLLHALYLYIQNKEAVKETDYLEEMCFSKVKRIMDISLKHDNVYKWYTASHKEKEVVSKSSSILTDIRNSEYVARANRLINSINISKTSVSDRELWDFFEKNSAHCYSVLDELCPGMFGNSDSFYGLPEELVKEIQYECFFPDGLLVTLRRYQEWGVKYILHQKNVLLGDEMGLGKTIQAIATMVSLRNTGAKHFIVVCPASVIINWCREIETHSKLKAIKIHGRGRKTAIKQWIANGGVAVTTYETTGVFTLPDDFKFDMLTVDEAHYCKNPEANRTINVRTLSKHTDRILYMTGTALENKVDEMIELISHLQPKVAEEIKNYSFMSAHETFKRKVAPVYYRRKREDVLTELPELIVNKEWCSLNREEKQVYEDTVLNGNYQAVRRVSWNVDDLSKSSKMNRLKEIIQSAKDEDRKVIVFSYFLDTISKIRENLGDKCTQPITGSINPRRRQEIIDDFNNAPSGSVLLAQIQAGGTGLNIQAASVVVITEPQFKPSIENQAISRAYRMGQTRNVLVHRLLCENTVDEKLMNVLEEKQMIFDAFADESVAANANKEIDEKTFGDIIKEEIERIKAEKENSKDNNE